MLSWARPPATTKAMRLFKSRKPPPSDPEALATWMQELFTEERYQEIWRHRLSLGVGFSQGAIPDKTWFWLNAYPALAAMRANLRWDDPLGSEAFHPLVATCAGWADQVHPGLGPREKAANAEIAQRFFGES